MILSDREIIERVKTQRMIEPFVDHQVSEGVISYGLSSYGYDFRVANEFKVFSNVNYTVIDPKNFDPETFVDVVTDDYCIVPPNSFVLARTVEYFRIPRDVLALCVGKCVTGDTRIVDVQTGDYLPIREFIARRGPQTLALGKGWKLGPAEVTAHRDNGIQPVYRLTTRAGLTIKATAHHPFRTWEGWTPLSELRPGDRIAVARSCPVFGREEWPEHEAILLGLLLSDGQCHTPGGSPALTTADPQIAEMAHRAAQAFGVELSSSPTAPRRYLLVNRRGRGGRMTRNRVALWLERLGCNVRAEEKFIPSMVFRARRERVASFLQALFSGDGSIYEGGQSVFLEYSTISRRLALDVRHLLLRFGIFALVRSKPTQNGKRVYWLQITDREMIRRFACRIGFLPGTEKDRRLREILPRLGEPRRSNFDTLPREAWARMREVVHAQGCSLNSLGIRTQPHQSLPYTLARQVVQAVQDPEWEARIEADVVWDTVVDIKPAGREPVYDLTVPEGHNFLANDFIVHNSTYARCGIIVNVTPFEPGWEGYATLEISNTTPLPARIYANEGIGQVVFLRASQECAVSYADRKGKYQRQMGIVLPRVG